MATTIMRAVSWLLHPMLLPSLLFVILFYYAPLVIKPLPQNAFPLLLLVVLITTFVVPLVSVIMLKSTHFISSYYMEDRRERIVPFMFITVFYCITAAMFILNSTVNSIFIVIFCTLAAMVFVLTIITVYHKVSVHSAGMAGLAGIILAVGYKFPANELLFPLAWVVLLSGLVMTSRLFLNSHRPVEVLVGSVVGFLICFLSMYIFT